ncbi:hypothetical protein C8Q74DRAFT_951972 [Fomes fomentarius]|nr:hypothetical protein C8Q74DRAFT_951972 [Fomes fomentarius]
MVGPPHIRSIAPPPAPPPQLNFAKTLLLRDVNASHFTGPMCGEGQKGVSSAEKLVVRNKPYGPPPSSEIASTLPATSAASQHLRVSEPVAVLAFTPNLHQFNRVYQPSSDLSGRIFHLDHHDDPARVLRHLLPDLAARDFPCTSRHDPAHSRP